MHPYIRITMIMIIAVLSGCASMSKDECLNANWVSVGYNDGSRGIHYERLNKHRQSCGKHEIFPDEDAYMTGWNQGIRSYCTTDRGYQAGRAGRAYSNICPADVEPAFLSGWQQGIRQYCTPENALELGLKGRGYNGVCPSNLAHSFRAYYELGRDVRTARSGYRNIDNRLTRHEQQMAATKYPKQLDQLRHQYHQMKRDEERAYTRMLALEACMNDDWYEAGYRDGEAGLARRAGEITGYCGKYGIGGDGRGYRQGWNEGIGRYCSYESGLHLGKSGGEYSGACSGHAHRRFWSGYEEGRRILQTGNHEYRRATRSTAPQHTTPQPRPRAAQPADDEAHGHDGTFQPQNHGHAAPAGVERPHDNRNREMNQPPAHSNAADPGERREAEQQRVHDNRDKEKQPMPGQSRSNGRDNDREDDD